MFTIKTYNQIAKIGLDRFDKQYTVSDSGTDPQAILLRSHKLQDSDVADTVCVIGRAGAGTNNIPVDAMSERGIPVLNTPGANANAVKELVLTGMLLAARNICKAWAYTDTLAGDNKALSIQVEAGKKQFAGIELPGKTLAVIGLGHIGVKVANAAIALGMDVIGYDPHVSVENAWQLSSDVMHAVTIEDALQHADFITIHVPLLDATKHLINANTLAQCQSGAILLNFSRDGIVNNDDCINALNSGQISQYVCDFPNTCFKHHDNVIALPHLGASTIEAEENCAVMIADQIKTFLTTGNILHSINFPRVTLTLNPNAHRIAIVNRNVPNMVAQISSVLSNAGTNIVEMINKSRQDIAYTLVDVDTAVTPALSTTLAAIDGVIRVRTL